MNNAYQTDLGIRRDTAAVDYRYTPNDNWDFRANYSHMRRTGTQVDGVLFGPNVFGRAGRRAEAGRRYHAELRRQRRIFRQLVLEPEVQRQGRL